MDGEKPKARILVLDDEAVICALLCERLSLEGYECRACYKPSEALALMARESFDLVLSDVRMPKRAASPSWKKPGPDIRGRRS